MEDDSPLDRLPALSADLFSLEGQTALVTGGSKGLGEAMTHALAGAGAAVVAADLRPPDETGALERWGDLLGEVFHRSNTLIYIFGSNVNV